MNIDLQLLILSYIQDKYLLKLKGALNPNNTSKEIVG